MKFYQTQYPIKKVTVLYNFNDSKMGFKNSVTVEAINDEQAIDKAKNEVAGVYGSSMLNEITFKLK
jgi:hypothetical protein